MPSIPALASGAEIPFSAEGLHRLGSGIQSDVYLIDQNSRLYSLLPLFLQNGESYVLKLYNSSRFDSFESIFLASSSHSHISPILATGLFRINRDTVTNGHIFPRYYKLTGHFMQLRQRTQIRLMTEIIETLATLHENNIAHLDLKCDNIMLKIPRDIVASLSIIKSVPKYLEYNIPEYSERHRYDLSSLSPEQEGRISIVITDFGGSSTLFYSPCTSEAVTISPIVRPPEMVSPTHILPISNASDIWSLGITLLELWGDLSIDIFAGVRSLYEIRELYRSKEKMTALLNKYRDLGISSDITDIISQCLQKNPRQRPTAFELLQRPIFQEYLRVEMGTFPFPWNVDRMQVRCPTDKMFLPEIHNDERFDPYYAALTTSLNRFFNGRTEFYRFDHGSIQKSVRCLFLVLTSFGGKFFDLPNNFS